MRSDKKMVTAIVFMVAPGQKDPTVKKYRNIKDETLSIERFIAFVKKENKYLHHINLYQKSNHSFLRQIRFD